MARPKKMTTEQMIEIVDSYYFNCCDGNEKLMKCSLIAEYAIKLGFTIQAYDLRRDMEVREHIERIKVSCETAKEVHGVKYQHTAYKDLDVIGFIRNNGGDDRITEALRELDAYWKQVYECSERSAKQNRTLMKEKSTWVKALHDLESELDKLKSDNSNLFSENNKLVKENRYLRKMLRTYLYPAIADQILKNENEPIQTNTEITDITVCDFIESGIPKSFEASVSKDARLQTESERLIERLRDKCDE